MSSSSEGGRESGSDAVLRGHERVAVDWQATVRCPDWEAAEQMAVRRVLDRDTIQFIAEIVRAGFVTQEVGCTV